MKSRYLKILLILVLIPAFQACEDLLDIEQQGVTSVETFYQDDDDALEAVAAMYYQWRGLQSSDFYIKNMLSDDIYAGGGARGDNSQLEMLNEYTFTPENTMVSGFFSGLYTLIYRANLIIENYPDPQTSVQRQVVAEAKVTRGWAYFTLVTLWGDVPLVTEILTGTSEFQTNTPASETWAQIEADYNEAISSGALPSKSSADDQSIGARLTLEAAKAFLGKAYVFEEKYSEAASILGEVIDSGLYTLIDDYENVLTISQDFGSENIFELNSILDEANAFDQGNAFFTPMPHWRIDRLTNWWNLGLSYQGWGFANPREKLYDAFIAEEGADSYRMLASIKPYDWLSNPVFPNVTLNDGAFVYGHEGYFTWKTRSTTSPRFRSL